MHQRPFEVTYNVLIDSYCRRTMIDDVVRCLGICKAWNASRTPEREGWGRVYFGEEVDEEKSTAQDYDFLRIIEVLCGKGESRKAVEIIKEFRRDGKLLSLIACVTLIEGLRKEKKMEEGLSISKRMIQDGAMVPEREGQVPDGEIYSILVYGFARERKREERKLVLDEMLDMGSIPTIAAYNALMDTLDHAAGSLWEVKAK
ncbi:hypothetical protein MLD38_016012 [Melastoma candidum]|uniref:Uncharacterized protein n=1 Tax=Melastoma candidum TaxID=119954 RepID=A0ACB9RJ72_9MYRT|nr:hypothetical protein MLD38_016012 [Melastoma candidum]